MMKNLLLLCLVFSAFFIFDCKKDKIAEILIPAGSVDMLAQAISDSPENGVIRLAAGTHSESATIVISKKVCIVGDDGAVLIVDTQPSIEPFAPLKGAFHFFNANGACIENIDIQPLDSIGGSGVILELSNNAVVKNCKFSRHQYSVMIEASNDVNVENNIISCTDAWQTGAVPRAHGLVVINGKRATIKNNTITGAVFGAWICDEFGTFTGNELSDNYIGVIPCAVPDSGAVMPRSNVTYSMIQGSGWTVSNNTLSYNSIGILLYDGADNCTLENNNSQNNALMDIELGEGKQAGEGMLSLPFPVDKTERNTIIVGPYPNVRIHDCGYKNEIDISLGGIIIPKDDVPCF